MPYASAYHTPMVQSEAAQMGESPALNGQTETFETDQDAAQTILDETAQEQLAEKSRREREARAQALTLEIVGDLPFAEVKPPENVLFVCKLNPVTEGQDGPATKLKGTC